MQKWVRKNSVGSRAGEIVLFPLYLSLSSGPRAGCGGRKIKRKRKEKDPSI
jgi:hypothetical protein